MPETEFTCKQKPYLPGFYADPKNCELYHYCAEDGKLESFYCEPGSLFNQKTLNCDQSQNVQCGQSHLHWSSNQDLGKVVNF